MTVFQGELWQRKYKNTDKTTIPLFLYEDEFETRDPLDSRSGHQKMAGKYATIAS